MTFVMEDEPWRNLEVVTIPWLAARHLKGHQVKTCCPGNGHDAHHHSVLWGGGGEAVKLYEPGRQTRIA